MYADLKEDEHSEYAGLCTLELTGFPSALDTAAAYLKTLTTENANSFYEERIDHVQVPTAAKFHVLGDQGLTIKGLQVRPKHIAISKTQFRLISMCF